MKKTEKYYDLALQEAGKYFNYTVKSIEKIISAGHKLMLWLLAFNAFLIKDIALGNPMSFLSILFFCLLPLSLYVFYNLYQCLFVPKAKFYEGIEPFKMEEYRIDSSKEFKQHIVDAYEYKIKKNIEAHDTLLKYYNKARKWFIVLIVIFIVIILSKSLFFLFPCNSK